MGGKGRDRFEELIYEGAIVAARIADGMRLRAGDVEVTAAGDEVQVRIKR